MGIAGGAAGWIMLLVNVAEAAGAGIHFREFGSNPELRLAGDAEIRGKAIRLTRAKSNRSGAVWFGEKQAVGAGFETSFEFQITRAGGLGHGADGFAFVIQNAGPEALGGRGSAGGFAVSDQTYHHDAKGIPWSIAVFFDTYRNGSEGDPSANYIAFCTHGRPAEMHWPAARLAFTPKLPFRLKDGKVHTARILFQPPALAVFLDQSKEPVLDAKVDLSMVTDAQGGAWVGFTASTGGGYENHDILNWSFGGSEISSSMTVVSSEVSFLMSACLPDRNLCTPERAVVEPNATGYHVVLPGNKEWGASIPDAPGNTVEVQNARGIVCWDVKARGWEGCSGPSGKEVQAGQDFLVRDAGAGALLVQPRDGRTWFWVNGRPADFRGNEGYYEFDVRVKRVVEGR